MCSKVFLSLEIFMCSLIFPELFVVLKFLVIQICTEIYGIYFFKIFMLICWFAPRSAKFYLYFHVDHSFAPISTKFFYLYFHVDYRFAPRSTKFLLKSKWKLKLLTNSSRSWSLRESKHSKRSLKKSKNTSSLEWKEV